MVLIKCNNSNKHDTNEPYQWNYKGNAKVLVACPKCHKQLNINKAKVE